jgi:hypothetical protein
MKKVFSFDAKTNGLWGKAFAIGALVYDEHGNEVARFVGRLLSSAVTDQRIKKNILPKLVGVPVTHQTYDELLSEFADFYKTHKQDADMITHMGYIVEAGLLRDMRNGGMIDDWDGPCPLFDVTGNLQQVGEDPTSVDGYAKKYSLSVPDFSGGTHNPLYDAAITAAVYRHLLTRSK